MCSCSKVCIICVLVLPKQELSSITNKSNGNPTPCVLHCSTHDIKDGVVNLRVEKELGVEIVGNTKVKVSVEEFDDDYEEIIDDELEDTIENIDAEYLDKDVN